MPNFYAEISRASTKGEKLLAILIDPDKFKGPEAEAYLKRIPKETSHIFVGGSSVAKCKTEKTVNSIKKHTNLPVILFPGDYSQITETADALLFLSLLSGRNPEYLIEQQIKSVENLRNSSLQIIPTAYILIDGGRECAVQRISKTKPIPQFQVETIVDTALAGEFSGKKLIYLEAGSGADFPVSEEIISEVKKAISIPLIVGGGIRSRVQQNSAYKAGADMIVMGTQFEK
ncbi:geranylgeranylglyceryl/heptaprenylglyceryl phosphate synthase [Salegentibacter sp. BLCTC]|uniref:geranylgeranylglyceryl/heptaprenylglyceryl phosphate synthase n=1 Tax=Salegentibacter sp. BLCTC TaxID=2697368 RepID=UPI00187B3728|nr:geranylgeranylglyceryl/heptaprenylglyceryl phosphate synthase [Salegentibacter sp. BLCTC]MBE7640780.1 geranylgeranylglyceryl/heptaprenylglyceryl phosphate synthase [Salegentibacter sp. BLCTC]